MSKNSQNDPDIKKYSKLLGTADYDHEAAEQLAEAVTEVTELERRASQLKQIINENHELQQFVWHTAAGQAIALHNIENEHLENIMLHLLRTGRPISRSIRGEALRRNLVIPATVPVDWDDDTTRRLRETVNRVVDEEDTSW